jgi:hypothetical protein
MEPRHSSAKASFITSVKGPSAEGVSPRAPRLNVTFFLKTSVPDEDHISFDPSTHHFSCMSLAAKQRLCRTLILDKHSRYDGTPR